MAKREQGKSAGQVVLESVARWIGSFMTFPDAGYAVVVALWAIGTWRYARYYSYPYLHVTSQTSGSGKTTLLEVLSLICQGGELRTGMTAANIYRMLADYKGKLTLLLDDLEVASSEARGLLHQVIDSGQRASGKIQRVVGTETITYSTYCPKAFGSIGDLNATARARSIVVDLVRADPPRDETGQPKRFLPWEAQPEARALTVEIESVLEGIADFRPMHPKNMPPRDTELWGTLFGLARSLDCDAAMMTELTRVAYDIVGGKSRDKRRGVSLEAEKDALLASYARTALSDLLRVLEESGTDRIFSAVAVTKMRDLPDAPWRTIRGTGLDTDMLANLLAARHVKPTTVRMRGAGRKAKPQKGYKLEDVRAALAI